MSKDISIKEGDLSRQFGHISKLNIANSGGGSSLWVPEEDVETKSLHVTKNGTYKADGSYVKTITTVRNGKIVNVPVRILNEENSCYGFDEVTVDIIDNVNGYDSDGIPKNISVGDNDYLVEKGIPSYINIVQEPTTTRYVDGQSISIKGIKVKAYYENGTEWGDVPFEELDFEPKKAQSGGGGGGNYTMLPRSSNLSEASTIANGLWCTDARVSDTQKGYELATDFVSGMGLVFYYTSSREFGSISVISAHDYDRLNNDVAVYSWAWYDSVSGWSNYSYGGKSAFRPHPDNPNVYVHNGSWWSSPEKRNPAVPFYQSYAEALEAVKNFAVGGDNVVTVSWDNQFTDEALTDIYEIVIGSGPIPPNN